MRACVQVHGAYSQRVAARAAEIKAEDIEYEHQLKDVRDQIMRENAEEVRRVREQTDTSVTDGSKQFALEQKRILASVTKAAEQAWKMEKKMHTESHLKLARANKAAAEASRKKAKELRAQVRARHTLGSHAVLLCSMHTLIYVPLVCLIDAHSSSLACVLRSCCPLLLINTA